MKHAKLPDGTILEFPPETMDDVIDRAVRDYMGVPDPELVRQQQAQEFANQVAAAVAPQFENLANIMAATGTAVVEVAKKIDGLSAAIVDQAKMHQPIDVRPEINALREQMSEVSVAVKLPRQIDLPDGRRFTSNVKPAVKMSINYPVALDDFLDPLPTTFQDELSHAQVHTWHNEAIEALQSKVGINGSLVTSSHDYLIKLANNPGHTHTGTYQPLDATLTSLAAYNTNGFIVQTAADTFVGRTLASADPTHIAITNPAGAAANPIFDIGSAVLTDTSTHTLTNKSFNANGTGNSITNLETADFAANVIDTDGTLSANSDTRLATQKAVKTYADQLIGAANAMVFKGVIDCSANPNYPAADAGWLYRVSVAGKIGGASGINVEIGDTILCLTDGTASGNQATVGTNWNVSQANIDGAVIGPASAVNNNFVFFDGTTGKLIKDAGFSTGTSGHTIPFLDGANTWSADQTLSGTNKTKYGTNAQIYHDGTYLTIDGALTGTTAVSIGPINASLGGTGRLVVNYIGLGGTPINTQFWINYVQTTNLGRGALQFAYTYTGPGPSLNILSVLRFQGTATSATALSTWQQAYMGADSPGAGSVVGMRSTVGFDGTSATNALTAGGTVRMHGLSAQWSGEGGTHTSGNIYWYGLEIPSKPNLTLSGAAYEGWGVNSCHDIQVYDDHKFVLGGSNTVRGDSYFIYNSGGTDVDLYVNAVQVMNFDDDLVDCKIPFQVDGTSGNTLQFINAAGPPSTLGGGAAANNDYYGTSNAGRNMLCDPDIWVLHNVGGTEYLFPGYLP